MPISTDPRSVSHESTILLVEDRGLLDFLPVVLRHTSLFNCNIHVLGGRGWTEVYRQYDALLASGISSARIIPVLDADKLGAKGERGPTSAIHANPNIFRFRFDLELEFCAPNCMLLDHALLLLAPDVFGEYGSVGALQEWASVVNEARLETIQAPSGQRPTLRNIEHAIHRRLQQPAGQGDEFRAPSKVTLAKVLARLCVATGAMPPELVKLFWIVEAHARKKPYPEHKGYQHRPRPLWDPVRDDNYISSLTTTTSPHPSEA